MRGQVIKLDRSLPLVKSDDGETLRCNYCAKLSKAHTHVAIGDFVEISQEESNDTGTIEKIEKRAAKLVRNDPVDRSREQILAANFDSVTVACVSTMFNVKTVLRQLVVAKNTRTATNLLLTKSDKLPLFSHDNEEKATLDNLVATFAQESNVSSSTVRFVLSKFDNIFASSVDGYDIALKKLEREGCFEDSKESELIKENSLCILLGNSGAGKSSLTNALAKKEVLQTCDVREYDEKGRHTTVAREIVEIDENRRVCDMPGLRALGLINCVEGLKSTFSEIYEAADFCKFRNCTHTSEPKCKVKENVDSEIVEMWRELDSENTSNSSR